MLKFFRRIRQSLLSENKFSKYLLYALGEIILVVIGILIALQINNWNTDRLDRDRERFLIQQMNVEMQDNLKQFNEVQQNILVLVNAGETIATEFPLDSEKVQQKAFLANFRDFLYCPSFDPYQGTIRSIINSGDLNLIQNDSLRKLIVSWDDVIKDYKEEERMAWEYGYGITEWAADHFPNPEHVSPTTEGFDFRGLQSRIGEKIGRYRWCIEGEDVKRLHAHLTAMIEMTSVYRNEAQIAK
ncbi:MAG: hypothetical protein HRT65_10595 [Flavobacteriaceae bacterium]|nr:hypothetical protein [Flavobacteriaceae bacterium]